MTQPILILGATSGIGKLTVENAVSRGLAVRAFARSADTLEQTDLLEPWPGDARRSEDLAQALEGCRAVIYALGIRERLAMLWQTETLFSESTRLLIPAMQAAGISRLVVVTGFGAGRSRAAMSTLERIGHGAVLGRPYADKDRQEALIEASDLDWTIARPVILTNGRADRPVQVLNDPESWRNGLVPRAGVARYLVDAVEQRLHIGQDVVLTR